MFLPTTDIYVEPVEKCTIDIQLSETLSAEGCGFIKQKGGYLLSNFKTALDVNTFHLFLAREDLSKIFEPSSLSCPELGTRSMVGF